MAFAAPIWLIGLIPWSLLAAWLMLGQHQRRGVPFLPLWRGPATRRAPLEMRFQPPPLAIVLALLALLLSLFAAGGFHVVNPSSVHVTVIVDRGLTMSAGSTDGPRFLAAARRAAASIPPAGEVDLIDPIDGTAQTVTGANWLDTVRALPRTAVDAGPMVIEAARDALASKTGLIVVLTDRQLPLKDARLAVVAPPSAFTDVGIIAMAARDQPSAQVMVTLRSHRPAPGAVTLTVTSNDAIAHRRVDLPATGDANVFLDLPQLGETVEARLDDATDDLPANDAAWLVRAGQSPRVEVRSAAVPEPVRRLAQIYGHAKPPSDDAPAVAIAADQNELANDAGAVVAPSVGPPASGEPRVATDPLTTVVDWKQAVTGAPTAAEPPRGDGWTPLVTAAGKPLIAKRESPARQVWVGFDQTAWSRSPDFVVFWANALRWLAGEDVRWFSQAATALGPGWKPMTPPPPGVEATAWAGIFKDPAGRMAAMNAVAIDFAQLQTADAKLRLPPSSDDRTTWAKPLMLAAMLCLFAAVLTWRGA